MYQILPVVYFVGIALSAICLLVILYQKPSREQNMAILIAFCCALIFMGYLVSCEATSVEALLLGTKLNYLGATNMYFAIFLFFYKYYQIKENKIVLRGMGIISIFFTFITFTCDKHKFFYRSYYMDKSSALPKLIKEYAPLHTAYILMVVIYCLITVIMTVVELEKRNSQNLRRADSISLLSIILIPNICYLLDCAIKPVVRISPFGLLVSVIMLTYLVGRGNICGMNQIAREYVFEATDDAVIVVDKNKNYKEANKLAKNIFPEIRGGISGESMECVSKEVAKLFELDTNDHENNYLNRGNKTYCVKIKPIKDRRRIGGYVIWLEDVTVEKNSMILLENFQIDLKKEVDRKTCQLKKMQEQMVNGFAAIVENKNLITGGHIQRTSGYVDAIAKELKMQGKYSDILTDTYLEKLRLVAPLHDIGKVSIPDQILDKPAKLTEEEFEIIKTHSENGARIIEKTMSESDDAEYFEMAKEIAKYHHEKWDGCGYPEGLTGECIPLNARIMAVADVFDALVSERPYKKAFSLDVAFSIIESESGKQFDPCIVDAFLKIKDNIICLYHEASISEQLQNVRYQENVQKVV